MDYYIAVLETGVAFVAALPSDVTSMTLDRYVVHARDNFTCPTLHAVVTPVPPGCGGNPVASVAYFTDDVLDPLLTSEQERASDAIDEVLRVVFGASGTYLQTLGHGGTTTVVIACASHAVASGVAKEGEEASGPTLSALSGASPPPPAPFTRCAVGAGASCAPDPLEIAGTKTCVCVPNMGWCGTLRSPVESTV